MGRHAEQQPEEVIVINSHIDAVLAGDLKIIGRKQFPSGTVIAGIYAQQQMRALSEN